MALTNTDPIDMSRQSVYGKYVPLESTWSPKLLKTSLWFDASDSSTITEVGGLVSQWNDKSGNGRHVTQGTEEFKPLLVSNYIQFDETDDFLSVSTTSLRQGNFEVYAVLYNSALVSDSLKSFISYNGGTNPDFFSQSRSTSIFGIFSNLTSGASQSVISASLNTKWLTSMRSGGNNYTTSIGVNGGTRATGSVVAQDNQKLGTELSIGRQKPGFNTRYFGGRLYEIIVTDILSDNDIAKVEGYLAWKYGITLNVNHPYYLEPPRR